MSYYRGDYYRGDYYRGDPFLGAVIKAGVGLARGAVKRTIGGLRNQGARRAQQALIGAGVGAAIPPLFQGGNPTDGLQIPGTGITINPGDMWPGGKAGITFGGPKGGQCPPGFHPNKADSLRGPKGTYCVRNRRMNELNPRALKRALRRAEGFEAVARRTVSGLRSGPRKFKKQ